jgi:hypothetical protein
MLNIAFLEECKVTLLEIHLETLGYLIYICLLDVSTTIVGYGPSGLDKP